MSRASLEPSEAPIRLPLQVHARNIAVSVALQTRLQLHLPLQLLALAVVVFNTPQMCAQVWQLPDAFLLGRTFASQLMWCLICLLLSHNQTTRRAFPPCLPAVLPPNQRFRLFQQQRRHGRCVWLPDAHRLRTPHRAAQPQPLCQQAACGSRLSCV
jgi:hypothetical protein